MPEECVCQPVVPLAGICRLCCCRKVVVFIREVDSAILKYRDFFFFRENLFAHLRAGTQAFSE